MKENLKQKLTRLGFINFMVFIPLFVAQQRLTGNEVLSIIAGLTILSTLLVESTVYWFIKRQTNFARRRLPGSQMREIYPTTRFLLFATYALNTIILLGFPPFLRWQLSLINTATANLLDIQFGIILYVISLLVFFHYFVCKLVKSQAESAVGRKSWVKARFRRELMRKPLPEIGGDTAQLK